MECSLTLVHPHSGIQSGKRLIRWMCGIDYSGQSGTIPSRYLDEIEIDFLINCGIWTCVACILYLLLTFQRAVQSRIYESANRISGNALQQQHSYIYFHTKKKRTERRKHTLALTFHARTAHEYQRIMVTWLCCVLYTRFTAAANSTQCPTFFSFHRSFFHCCWFPWWLNIVLI